MGGVNFAFSETLAAMEKQCYLLSLILLVSCSTVFQTIGIHEDNIEKVEVFQGFPGEKIEMKDQFEKSIIDDLNNSKDNGPTKFMKTHRILIYHSDGKIDTLYTNGRIHQFNGWYKTEDNLIEKYSR